MVKVESYMRMIVCLWLSLYPSWEHSFGSRLKKNSHTKRCSELEVQRYDDGEVVSRVFIPKSGCLVTFVGSALQLGDHNFKENQREQLFKTTGDRKTLQKILNQFQFAFQSFSVEHCGMSETSDCGSSPVCNWCNCMFHHFCMISHMIHQLLAFRICQGMSRLYGFLFLSPHD